MVYKLLIIPKKKKNVDKNVMLMVSSYKNQESENILLILTFWTNSHFSPYFLVAPTLVPEN